MVLLGWALGKPLALLFDPFESVVSGALYTCTTTDNSADCLFPRFCTFPVSVVPGIEESKCADDDGSTHDGLCRRRRQVKLVGGYYSYLCVMAMCFYCLSRTFLMLLVYRSVCDHRRVLLVLSR